MAESISHEKPAATFRRLLHEWADLYKRPTQNLINHLRQEGYSDARIARIIGISRQALNIQYKKAGKNEK
jgi:hypothetical protein